AVGESTLAGPDPAYDGGRVRAELDDAVVAGVRDEETVVQRNDLRGETEIRRLGGRGDVRRAAAGERTDRLVLSDEVGQQGVQGVQVPLTGVLRDDVAVRIHQHQRRPGAGGVVLPRHELGIVQHRVRDLVPLDGAADRGLLALVRELRRVHADD